MERLYAFLRVPSISARPEHAADMRRAAELCATEVRLAAGTAEVRPGSVHPLVVGDVPASIETDARVLVYGHYDVQPPEPLDDWESLPFEPTVRGDHLYARGASDDKGHLFMLFRAVQALVAASQLPVHVTFVIDGEEESGGDSAVSWIAADTARVDAAIIFDTPMLAPARPAFYVGVRGSTGLRIAVRTGRAAAHSGLYGGAALNAAHVLVDMLHAVLPRGGRTPVELATGVTPPSAEELAGWELLPPGANALRDAGLVPADDRAAEEFYLRTLALPALDIHGMRVGPDAMDQAIVPETAEATLSVRLAPGQRTADIRPALMALLRGAAPPGAEVALDVTGDAEPALTDASDPALTHAADAVEAAIGWRPVAARIGGSLPVAAAISERGIPLVLSGFYVPEDAIHAPNERIRLDHLTLGARAAVAILLSFGMPH